MHDKIRLRELIEEFQDSSSLLGLRMLVLECMCDIQGKMGQPDEADYMVLWQQLESLFQCLKMDSVPTPEITEQHKTKILAVWDKYIKRLLVAMTHPGD